MRRIELELEHHYKNKFIGRHRLTGNGHLTVIGSSKTADIRLLGDDVSLIHAYLEHSDNGWKLIDAGSEQGTWISKKPITSKDIDDDLIANIGGHELRLKPRKLDFELFGQEDLHQDTATGTIPHHQVILRKHGKIIKTLLMPERTDFIFPFGDKNHPYAAPKKGEFKETQLGDFTIQQRLVLTGPLSVEAKSPWERLLGPEARALFLSIIALFFLGGLIAVMMPKGDDAELTPPKLEENRFTKMIFDSEVIKKKRAEAREKQKKFLARSPAGTGTPEPSKQPITTNVRSKGGAPKVISQLKMDGLQSLLGKISKRATATGVKIASNGNPADRGGAGRAMPVGAAGSLQGVSTQAGNGGSSYRVGAVGTFGTGGGGDVKGVGGLAMGGIGSASVGIVDDETEIEGGLDKDVIARVINSQLGEIRYCYERQLAANPELYGKVVVRFAIDGGGIVATQRVSLSTLKSAMVEGCILRRVASWQFPKPKGGTTVLVTYPFLFKSTN